MESAAYLCFAEPPSHGPEQQPDWTALLQSMRWHCFTADLGYTVLKPEASGIRKTSGTVSKAPPGSSVPSGDNVISWPTIFLVLAVEIVLIYVTYELAWRLGIVRRGCFRTLLERVKKMMSDEKTRESVRPEPVPLSRTVTRPSPGPVQVKVGSAERPAPESVPGKPAAAERPPAETTPAAPPSEDPAKVGWKNFQATFRERDAHEPFPSIDVAPAVSADGVESLLEDGGIGVKGLLETCRDRVQCRDIALEFLAQFPTPASEWEAASLLMTADADTTYWVAGDVHAKVAAIAKVCAVIADRHRRGLTKTRNVLVLLGDYVDRGDEPLETLAFVESLRLCPLFDGFEVITLKGNHDVGLSLDKDGKYVSMVTPAETAAYLQSLVDAGEDVSVEAEAAMRLAAVSPRLCELTGIDPDNASRTMLFVHGGVPHVDLQEKLYAARNGILQCEPFFKALDGEAVPEELRRSCAEDFTWIRLAKDLPVKLPNRGSHGCEIGTEDVAQYLFLHRALMSRDITFMFRGHDHERPGFACYSPHPELNPTKKKFAQRECNVLTLNAMEPDNSSSGMFRDRDLALAEWSLGEPVRLIRIGTRHLEEPKATEPEPPPKPAVLPSSVLPPQVQPEDLCQEEK